MENGGARWTYGMRSLQPNQAMQPTAHIYEVRPRKDHRGVNLISDALPFGWAVVREPDAIRDAISNAVGGSIVVLPFFSPLRFAFAHWQRRDDSFFDFMK